MASILPSGSGPVLLIGAVAIGAYLFMSQRRPAPATAQASQASRRRLPARQTIDRTQTYANPQTMGELLARTVVGAVNGFLPRLPSTAAASVGTVEARDAIRQSEAPGYYGWSGPTITAVDPGITAQYGDGDPYWGGMVDSIPAGPVYDVSTDIAEYAWTGDAWAGAGW